MIWMRSSVSTSEWQAAYLQPGARAGSREILGHLLGQRRDQDALVDLGADPDLLHQVVDLVAGGADLHLGVDDARWADDLLDDPRRGLALELARGRGDHHDLADAVQELAELERPVVEGGGQPEAEVDEGGLA